MEMRCYSHSTPSTERLIIRLYWMISGYGLRAIRALLSLAMLIAVFALLLELVGFRHHFHPSYLDSLLYATQSVLSLSLKGSGDMTNAALTRWGEVLHIILRIAGPGLIALALLSVRNRIKR